MPADPDRIQDFNIFYLSAQVRKRMVSDIDPGLQFYRQVLQFPELQLLQLLEDLPRPAVPPTPNVEKHFWISSLSHFGHLAEP